mgnify:CR=1 FL=1
MSSETENLKFAVSLMSNEKLAELIEIAIEELNKRKGEQC